MKRLPVIMLLLAAVCTAIAADYGLIAEKAGRFFRHREWGSASAMYELMLEERPDVTDTYSHAIVSAAMLGDSTGQMRLLEMAMSHSLPFDSVMNAIRRTSLEAGNACIYESVLIQAHSTYPWMSRAIDRCLLDWYILRADGANIVKYSKFMLLGLPDNVGYLNTLAYGYMLEDDLEAADETLRRVLLLDPDNYKALIALGNSAATRSQAAAGEDRERLRSEARKLLSRAYAVKPTPFVADMLKNL